MPKISTLFILLLPFFSKATNYFVSTTGNDANNGLSATTPVLTISKAVSLTTNGDIINIASGSYTEQVVINSKSIELKGVGVGNTVIQCPTTLPQYFLRGSTEQHAIILIANAANIKIDSLTVDGLTMGATLAGASTVYNFNGIGLNNSSGTIDRVEVKNITDNPVGLAQRGTGILAYANAGVAQTINVTSSNIHDVQQTNVLLDGANLTATLNGNTVTGFGTANVVNQNGVVVSGGALATVASNIISGFNYSLLKTSTAIYFMGVANGSAINANTINNCNVGIYVNGTTTVSQNTINNPTGGYGIYVLMTALQTIAASNNFVIGGKYSLFFDTLTAAVNANIHNNSFTNADSFTIANNSNLAAVDASCNWYGTASIPTFSAKIKGNVNFIPYLANGTDYDAATPGFQPVPSSCATPVPLTLLDFSATRNYNGALLQWTTLNETNVQGFSIEKSWNTTSDWKSAGDVKATGSTNSQNLYSFLDSSILKNGTYYYRLKMKDNDGSFTLSPVKVLTITDVALTNYNIFPNPAIHSTYFTISSLATGNYTEYKLYDASGKLLRKGNFTQKLTLSIPLPGVYLIEFVTNGVKETKKIIVR